MRLESWALLGMLFVGCGQTPSRPDAGQPSEAESPLAKRFLPDTLPWPVSADATSTGLIVTAGINAQVQIREPRYRPVALSADALAVVFPPADKTGFDVAFGGFEQGWQREPLTSIAANQVASLDAIADRAGGAWIALRLLDRRQKLVLLHWAPGQPVTTERLDDPVGINPIRLPYLDACNDVTLGLSPSGALDFIVRGDPNPLETLLFHGRRNPSAGAAFTWTQVVNGRKARTPVPQGSAWDFGCKSALTYDGLGRAVLAVLVQQTSETRAGLSGRHTAVFTEGKDGRFWPKEAAFMTVSDEEPTELRGLLDLASHPTGYVFGGPAVAYQRVPSEATGANPDGRTPFAYLDAYHPYFPRSVSFTGDRQLATDFRFAIMSGERLIGVQSGGQPVPRRGGKLLADGCGQFGLAVTDWDEPDTWSYRSLGKSCRDPRPAPVFRRGFTGLINASFSHGFEPPYSVGVCLDASRQSLGICFGGHEGREQAPEPVENLRDNPLVAASIAPGQQGVSLDAGLELEFGSPVRDVAAVAEVYDLDIADRLFGDWRPVATAAARYVFSPRKPLKAENHYRVVVTTQNQAEAGPAVLLPWQTSKGRFEVLDFMTGGQGPVRTDVWSAPFGLDPRTERDDAGVPLFFFDDRGLELLGREPIRMVLSGQIADDYGRTTIDAGLIRRADGGLLPDASFELALDSRWIDVPAPRDAGEQETFVVELPAFFDRDGRAFEDRAVRVTTGYFSLRVTGSVPADQATVSVAPTELILRVNRPDPELKVNGTAFGIEEVNALDGGVQVDTIPFSFAASPFEVRLTPSTPLRAGGIYRVVSRITVTPVTLATFAIAP